MLLMSNFLSSILMFTLIYLKALRLRHTLPNSVMMRKMKVNAGAMTLIIVWYCPGLNQGGGLWGAHISSPKWQKCHDFVKFMHSFVIFDWFRALPPLRNTEHRSKFWRLNPFLLDILTQNRLQVLKITFADHESWHEIRTGAVFRWYNEARDRGT